MTAAFINQNVRKVSFVTTSENGSAYTVIAFFAAFKFLHCNFFVNSVIDLQEHHLPSFHEQLQSIVKKAQHLQQRLDYVLYDENTTGTYLTSDEM